MKFLNRTKFFEPLCIGLYCLFVMINVLYNAMHFHFLQQTRREWQNVFMIAAMVHYCGVIFYAIFASGEKQDWADPESTSEEKCGIIEEDELAQEVDHSYDSSFTTSKIKSYGATTENSAGCKKGWKKKRDVTMEKEDETGQTHYENGDYQEDYQ